VIGTVQASALALGFLFLSLYGGILENLEELLFGSFLGITTGDVRVLAAVTVGVLVFFALAGRPLLFASVDEQTAAARGVPVRLLDIGFLIVLGLAVAATAQITGVTARFRPARRASRVRAAADGADPPQPRAERRVRTGNRVGRADARLLHRVLARLLRLHARLRPLPRLPRRPRAGVGVTACSRTSSSATRCSPECRSRSRAVRSATSSSCAVRSSPATCSATSRSPARSRPLRPGSTCASACSRRPCSSPRCLQRSASAHGSTT